MTDWELLKIILALGLVVTATRALPFVFGKHLQQLTALDHLKRFLPGTIMLLLTCYELQTIETPLLLEASIALVLTLVIHYFLRNMILSMILGTGIFVALPYVL